VNYYRIDTDTRQATTPAALSYGFACHTTRTAKAERRAEEPLWRQRRQRVARRPEEAASFFFYDLFTIPLFLSGYVGADLALDDAHARVVNPIVIRFVRIICTIVLRVLSSQVT